jgi:deoxycytidine triphosphate deaminase
MIMTDGEIRPLCHKGKLIKEGFVDERLRGCTYEFTVGKIAYRYDYQQRESRQESKDSHIIYPFETLTVVTQEQVDIDWEHYLFLWSKGFLFSLGVVPVFTGADPGFSGHLGITLTNLSARPIVLPVGTRFVKGVFFRLDQRVVQGYIGQHGDATMDWPYPSQYQAEKFDLVEYAKHLQRFLPAPLAGAILATGSISRYLKWIIGILTFVAVGNLGSYFIALAKPATWAATLLSVLNVVGAVASIIGLVLSIYTLNITQKSSGK